MVMRHLQSVAARGREAGQTTAEYALVILGAAAVAALLLAWAKGGAVSDLFDKVLKAILP
jgi:Flp pilus assembly pilin Flp